MKETNNILLIGNGFDLQHGMATSYADLLRFYIGIRDKSEQYDFDSTVISDVQKWVENSFFDYFVSEYEDRCETKNWIDMERGIKNFVRTLIEFFEYENTMIRSKKKSSGTRRFVYAHCSQEEALMLVNAHFLGKTEGTHIDISKKFITFQGLYDIEEMINAMSNELSTLEKIIAYYLNTVEPHIRKDKKRYHAFAQIQKINPEYIISFNYTDTPCNLYNINKQDICYIHGDLSTNNVVLGYDDEDSDDKDMVFKKYYRRITKYTKWIEKRRTYYFDSGFQINRNLYIFGHSLDMSDEDILRPLIEDHKTVVFYRNDREYAEKIRNLFLLLEKSIVLEKIRNGSIQFERIETDE